MPLENKPSPVKPRTPACLSPQQHRELYEPENALQCYTDETSVTQYYKQKVLQGVMHCLSTNDRRAEGNEGAVAFLQNNNNASNKVSSNNLRKFIHFAQNFLSFEFLSFNFLVFNFWAFSFLDSGDSRDSGDSATAFKFGFRWMDSVGPQHLNSDSGEWIQLGHSI